MNYILLLGIILTISVLSCKLTNRRGVPILVGFILIGALIGVWFGFDNVKYAELICNFALVFIMFTGGFQTDFAKVKPALAVSTLLSALGTVLTAGAAAAFAYFILNMGFHASMLLGAVISATDAASVFSVLSSKKLNLKNNLGSILQMESGSNDPFAYMLTIVFLSLATGESQNIVVLLLKQLIIGAAIGIVGAKLGQFVINKLHLKIDGLYIILLCGIAILMFGTAGLLDGNGFLALYIGGIILGNSKLIYKRFLSRMLSVTSMLMQIVLFVVLGMLWVPGSFLMSMLVGLIFAIFLFFFARPAIVFLLMKPFGYKIKEIVLVSWAGFRGASSIVFATYLLTAKLPYANYIFNLVFFVCMLSVIFQGSLLAPLTKRLKLGESEDKSTKSIEKIVKDSKNELLEFEVTYDSIVFGKSISELDLPKDISIMMIKRDEKYLMPIKTEKFMENDILLITSNYKNWAEAIKWGE